MDLSQLLFFRLSSDEGLAGMLAKYAGQPAIFNTEFPPDQQEGWGGKPQYPRIEYQFSMQADAKRASSGTLMLNIYTEKNPIEAEQIEMYVKRSLKDMLMKPTDEAPFCVAWFRTDPFMLEGSAILCKEMLFDIMEYPEQITTEPDPVWAMQKAFDDEWIDMYVIGQDDAEDYVVATEDRPIVHGMRQRLQAMG